MDQNLSYLLLAVTVIIALFFLRRRQLLYSLMAVVIGGGLYYTQDNEISISETIYETIDNSVRSDYEQKTSVDLDRQTVKKEE